MKVFEIYVENTNPNQYNSCVVVAENIEAVKAMITHVENEECSYTAINHNSYDEVHFYDSQGEIHIREVDLTKANVDLAKAGVDLTKAKIICASFNAG